MSIILINQYKGEPTVYIEYIVIGGGGGGGGPTGNGMGGGGGAGVTVGSRYLINNSVPYSVSVGGGGAVAAAGGASSFASYTAGGGGQGGNYGGGSGGGGTGLDGASGGGGGTSTQGASPSGGGGGGGRTGGGSGVYQYNQVGSANYYSIAGGGGGGYSSGGVSATVVTQTGPFGAITGYYAVPGSGGNGYYGDSWGQFGGAAGGGGGFGGSSQTANAGSGGGNGYPGGGGNAAQSGGGGLVLLRHPKEFPMPYIASGLAAGYPTNDGTYIVYKWSTSGSIMFNPIYIPVEYLVVGGGGAYGLGGGYGGNGGGGYGGGGGAGGLRTATSSTIIKNLSYPVAVGVAGASSTFETVVSAAGGAGGNLGSNGSAGASGGGGSGYQPGGTLAGSQGNSYLRFGWYQTNMLVMFYIAPGSWNTFVRTYLNNNGSGLQADSHIYITRAGVTRYYGVVTLVEYNGFVSGSENWFVYVSNPYNLPLFYADQDGISTTIFKYSAAPIPTTGGTATIGHGNAGGTGNSETLTNGSVSYTSSGTYSWTAPAGVTSVCVVAVGGGGSTEYGGGGGGGGGLGWKNNISVTPGQSYTVVVGIGGVTDYYQLGQDGGDSWFINATTVKGGGGKFGTYAGYTGPTGTGLGGNYVGDGGGNGGGGFRYVSFTDGYLYGGGGAGGYSGPGGSGGWVDLSGSGYVRQAGSSGNGGGGGGGGSFSGGYGLGNGGGVGIFGEGASGATGEPGSGGSGKLYGGGSLASSSSSNNTGRAGGNGAVRILWGTERAFPSTNVSLASDSFIKTYSAGAGGGGAGGVGGTGLGITGGNSGAGAVSSITGTSAVYARGGAGGGFATVSDINATDGSIYGNGGSPQRGTAVAVSPTSGVVILAYPDTYPQLTIPGTLTYTVSTVSRPGYRVYTFTAGSGQVTF